MESVHVDGECCAPRCKCGHTEDEDQDDEDQDDGVLEVRVPRGGLNPWAGFGVMALHSHTAEQPCDDRCTEYRRNGHAGDQPTSG